MGWMDVRVREKELAEALTKLLGSPVSIEISVCEDEELGEELERVYLNVERPGKKGETIMLGTLIGELMLSAKDEGAKGKAERLNPEKEILECLLLVPNALSIKGYKCPQCGKEHFSESCPYCSKEPDE